VGIERCRRNQEKQRHSSLRHSDIEAKLKTGPAGFKYCDGTPLPEHMPTRSTVKP